MFSMTIALFAGAELNETCGSPTFRPHTQAILLALIRRVLQPVDPLNSLAVITPSPTVDLPQTIILKYSSVVPWSWRVWSDNRVLDSEIIDHLTCTWLFDINKPSLRDQQYPWQESIYTTVHGAPSAAISSFARAFRHFSACLKSNEILSTESLCTLHRLCWVTTQLLRIPESTQTSFEPIIEDICQSICYVFILLEDPEKDSYIKNLALEYLTLVTPKIVRPVLMKCTQDPKLFAKLDEKLTSLTRKIRTRSLSDTELVVIRQMLHFLTIAWNCDVTKLAYRQTTTAFLAALLDLLITHPTDRYEDALADALVTALALVERLRRRPDFKDINKLWDDDSIWTLCLRHESSNLAVASAFSAYIEACGGNRQCQSLTVLDAWDHIRDVMMLIVHHEFLEDDEAIALLIIPSISSALENIFIHLGETSREFIDASPWTSNLSDSLHELASHPSDDEYISILQSRLTLDVPWLLRKASNKPKASKPNVEEAGEEVYIPST
ncbi:hypothetical protein QCA50_001704 [Cerrena zonata]|uniref:Uncharacterized protein n=1 Tax=Cerrena zonata TaxID=2478898 RepID=A0AAW0GVJ6_9APHY